MTQEDKELLLKDLCARLPYDLVINTGDKDLKLDRQHKGIGVLYPEDCSDEFNERNNDSFYIIISGCYYGNEIKPYLRPMSSMTREEQDRYDILVEETVYRPGVLTCSDLINFCHEHHLDNLGLIERGLALEAPAGMYE